MHKHYDALVRQLSEDHNHDAMGTIAAMTAFATLLFAHAAVSLAGAKEEDPHLVASDLLERARPIVLDTITDMQLDQPKRAN